MKKITILLAIMFCFILLNAKPSGITQKMEQGSYSVKGKAALFQGKSLITEKSKSNIFRDNWIAIDSLEIDKLLRPGFNFGYHYNMETHQGSSVSNMEYLSPEAVSAINKVPNWMKADLENVLLQLSNEKQIIWANIINNAIDPYIDEIAFCIAHTSVVYLQSTYSNPQLFIDNANLLYAIDEELSYVQIMNHGTSSNDNNYYSTTKYRKQDSNGNISEVEVPKDIYYWYIVHPKTSDEIPAYINPNLIEDNNTHANNITDPANGKFWRQLFFYETHDTLPVLGAMLDSCNVVWNPNNGNGDAIHEIQDWINAVMSFTSNTERPHQPVRIYQKGFGRCGEYGDITIAAARTALIPCTSMLSASTDHVWNEFWDGDWHQWEPVNHDINNPLVYENGWGKVFGSVMEIRSDGYLSPVTDRYSEGSAVINIHVLDNEDNPLDGASVKLAINDNGTIRFDALGYTDNNGLCQFIVGDNRHYYVRVNTILGNNPEVTTEYLDIVENSQDNQEYNYQVVINNTLPSLENTTLDAPVDEVNDYRLVMDFNAPAFAISGFVAWDDIDVVGQSAVFYKEINQAGRFNSHFMTYSEYSSYQLPGFPFTSFNSAFNVSQSASFLNLPSGFHMFAGFDNYTSLKNLQYVKGHIYLEQYTSAIDDDLNPVSKLSLKQNYPNPFNPNTTISFNIVNPALTELSIFNIKGQKVKTLCNKVLPSGTHEINWNGKNDQGKNLSSGIYFYRLKSANLVLNKKMIMIK